MLKMDKIVAIYIKKLYNFNILNIILFTIISKKKKVKGEIKKLYNLKNVLVTTIIVCLLQKEVKCYEETRTVCSIPN